MARRQEGILRQIRDEAKHQLRGFPRELKHQLRGIDPLRVYYDVEVEPEQIVKIRAVGIKERNRVRIGGEVIEL